MSGSVLAQFSFASATSGTQGEVALSAILAVVFAVFGYRLSVRNQALRGVTPWRFPSIIWALICFAMGPFGIIVELLAEFTTRPRANATLAPPPLMIDQPTFAQPSATVGVSAPYSPVVPSHAPPPDDGTGKGALFGWYPDVTKRHELRYWDGKRWSDLVSDQGVRDNDPL